VPFHQDAQAALVGGVRLPFLGEDGDLPVVLARDNGLIVPISAAHQAHRDRRPPPASPRRKLAEIVLGVAQVGLHGETGVRPVVELGLGQDLAEDAEDDVLRVVLLHVQADERALLPRQSQNGAEALLHGFCTARRIDGAALREERRDLDGEVEARATPAIEGIQQRRLPPSGESRRELAQQVEVLLEVLAGFGFGDRGLPEQVQRKRHALAPEGIDGVERLLHVRAADEPAGQPVHAHPDRARHHARRRVLHSPARDTRNRQLLLAEVLSHVPDQLLVVAESREDVDEAQGLDPELRVRHQLAQEDLFPVLSRPEVALPLPRHLQQLAAELSDARLQVGFFRCGHVRSLKSLPLWYRAVGRD
jgi:hypothetical protein